MLCNNEAFFMLEDGIEWLVFYVCVCACMYVFMRVSTYERVYRVCVFVHVGLVYTLRASLGGHIVEDSFILSVGCTN